MPIPFLSDSIKRLLQRSRAKYYGDTLSLRYLSGSSISDPSSLAPIFTTADGNEIKDAWGRSTIDSAQFQVVSGEVLIPGTFAWAPTQERRFLPLGLSPESEALFSCDKAHYEDFIRPHTFIIRDGIQLEVDKITKGLTTDEIYVVFRKIREDDTGEST